MYGTGEGEHLHVTRDTQRNAHDAPLTTRRVHAAGRTDVCLRREVHDGVHVLHLQHEVHEVGGRDVALDEQVVGQTLHLRQVLQRRAVVQLVEVDDLVVRVLLREQDDDVRCAATTRAPSMT
jgi:hypothetical protein